MMCTYQNITVAHIITSSVLVYKVGLQSFRNHVYSLDVWSWPIRNINAMSMGAGNTVYIDDYILP